MASKSNKNVKIVQLLLFLLGIVTIIVGFYINGSSLVQFVANNFSKDKSLSEETIKSLNSLHTKVIVAGVLVIMVSILLKYPLKLWDLITKKIQSTNLVERFVNFIGKILSLIFRIVTKEKFLFSVAILILLGFLIPSIMLNPTGGVHVEGINLQPPKNLVAHGYYATLTTKGFDTYTYRISAGPGILLPDALIFKLFGINVYYARALYTVFVFLAILMLYYLTREIFNKKVALLALFLLIPLMPLTGNQAADAYIPGLFYFLVGTLFWFRAIDLKRNIYLILSGLLWGLSFQTQWLFLFAIFAVITTCIILHFAGNGLKSKYYIIPTLMVILVTIAWTIFRILNVGMGEEIKQLQQFWAQHGHRAIGTTTKTGIVSSVFSIFRPIETLIQVDIWRDLQFFLVVPAIIYLLILIIKNKWIDYKNLFFLSFTLIWFFWWLIFNYDLPETHFYIVMLMSQLFIAKLLYDIWEYSFAYKNNFVELANDKTIKKDATINYLIRIVIICIVIGKTVFPLFEAAGKMYSRDIELVKPFNKMMYYINNNIEKNAVFSGWNESMPWYVDLNNNFDRINKNRAIYPFNQREKVPEYFIVSPEWPYIKVTDEWPSVFSVSKKNEDLRKKFIEENCTLLKSFGGERFKWLLFKVNNENTQ